MADQQGAGAIKEDLVLKVEAQQGFLQEVLNGSAQVEETPGIALTDVRMDDLMLPERVGVAFDERQVAEMEGEAAQWRLRGKWQDIRAQNARL